MSIAKTLGSSLGRVLTITGVILIAVAYYSAPSWFRYDGAGGIEAAQPADPSINLRRLALLTNNDRVAAGLPPLTESSLLDKSASDKCQDEVVNNYYAHTSPTGVQGWSFIKHYTLYRYAGENLAEGFSRADQVEGAFMASPEHKANILNQHYTEFGLATCKKGNTNETIVHFIQPL